MDSFFCAFTVEYWKIHTATFTADPKTHVFACDASSASIQTHEITLMKTSLSFS